MTALAVIFAALPMLCVACAWAAEEGWLDDAT